MGEKWIFFDFIPFSFWFSLVSLFLFSHFHFGKWKKLASRFWLISWKVIEYLRNIRTEIWLNITTIMKKSLKKFTHKIEITRNLHSSWPNFGDPIIQIFPYFSFFFVSSVPKSTHIEHSIDVNHSLGWAKKLFIY